MSAEKASTVRVPASHAYSAASLAHTPTLALPPLSPDRAPKYRPSGSPTAGPTGGTSMTELVTGCDPVADDDDARSIGMRRPSARTTTWCTSSLATSAGQ